VDLNGRTLPWEAAILIPFANEALFLESEQKLYDEGFKLTDYETTRNTISFSYPQFIFEEYKMKERENLVALQSTLTHMKKLDNDCTSMELIEDYESCGLQHGFVAKLAPGIKPNNDFPSLMKLGVQKVEYEDK